MNPWLDTKTKAILRNTPPDKLAPPTTKGFSLVLLSVEHCQTDWLSRSIQRICVESTDEINKHANQNGPTVLCQGLSESDAFLGQFELICCDAISVFIPDHVVNFGEHEYLDELYSTLLRSSEFAETKVVVDSIPDSESGSEFVNQFFGMTGDPIENTVVPFKKARIMVHWGSKVGAKVRIVN